MAASSYDIESSLGFFESDDECVEIPNPNFSNHSNHKSPNQYEDDEDEVQIVGQKGEIANCDFPHNASDCCAKTKPCKLCYCYVCDVPVDMCSNWTGSHCKANPKCPKWQKQRQNHRERRSEGQSEEKSIWESPIEPMIALRTSLQELNIQKSALFKYPLNFVQKQIVNFMENNEQFGVQNLVTEKQELETQEDLTTKFYGGIVAAQMGLGKTGASIHLILMRPMLTLIVVPPGLVHQWVEETQKFAPSLRVASLYANRTSTVENKITELDVIIISFQSKISPIILKHTKRIIIDESQEFFPIVLKSSFVKNKDKTADTVASLFKTSFRTSRDQEPRENRVHLKNIKYRWCLSGTPFKIWNEFIPYMKFFCGHDKLALRSTATLNDVKKIVFRIDKDQKKEDGTNVIDIPRIEYDVMSFKLSNDERNLYDALSCYEKKSSQGWSSNSSVSRLIHDQFNLRLMLLNHEIVDLRNHLLTKLHSNYYSDHLNLFECYYAQTCTSNYLQKLIKNITNKTNDDLSLIQLVKKVEQNLKENEMYKVILVTDNEKKQTMLIEEFNKIGIATGVFKRPKGSTSIRVQRELSKFQNGKFKVVISSTKIMTGGGMNMQEACHIIFLDTVVDDSDFKQACHRIARFGTKHDKLRVTISYVENTISHWVTNAHLKRSNDDSLSIGESLKQVFDENAVDMHNHQMEPPVIHHRYYSTKLPIILFQELAAISYNKNTAQKPLLDSFFIESIFDDILKDTEEEEEETVERDSLVIVLDSKFPFSEEIQSLELKFDYLEETLQGFIPKLESVYFTKMEGKFVATNVNPTLANFFARKISSSSSVKLATLLKNQGTNPIKLSACLASYGNSSPPFRYKPLIASKNIIRFNFSTCKKCLHTAFTSKWIGGKTFTCSLVRSCHEDKKIELKSQSFRYSHWGEIQCNDSQVTDDDFQSIKDVNMNQVKVSSDIVLLHPLTKTNEKMVERIQKLYSRVCIPYTLFSCEERNDYAIPVQITIDNKQYKTVILYSDYKIHYDEDEDVCHRVSESKPANCSIAYIPLLKDQKRKRTLVAQNLSFAIDNSPIPKTYFKFLGVR